MYCLGAKTDLTPATLALGDVGWYVWHYDTHQTTYHRQDVRKRPSVASFVGPLFFLVFSLSRFVSGFVVPNLGGSLKIHFNLWLG
jgi:hypothetical protein